MAAVDILYIDITRRWNSVGIDHKESGNPGLYSKTMKSDFCGFFVFFSILVAQVHLKHLIEMGRSQVPEACTYTTNSPGYCCGSSLQGSIILGM